MTEKRADLYKKEEVSQFGNRNGQANKVNSWMLCFCYMCGHTRPDTRVYAASKLLCVHLYPNKTIKNHCSWTKWSLTHTGDSVNREVAAFTLALETTGNVVTFLVTSGWKFRIGTLIDVCAVTWQQALAVFTEMWVCVLRSVRGCLFFFVFIFNLTVLAALPLPAGFAHTPERSLAIHAHQRTLLVARVRRALVTDLWC